MEIDAKLITYLEDLSSLTLTEEERQRLPAELEKILAGMAKLSELNTEETPECSHPAISAFGQNIVNDALREDVVLPSFARESILKNAFESDGAMFVAPKTV